MDVEGPYRGGDFSGRYPVIRQIGKGGMAVVYEIFDVLAEERRALKVVHPRFRMNQKILDRTLAEARAGITLRHPNLVRVYEVGTDGNNLCLVMELLEGRTLGEMLDRRGRFPLAETLELAAQIADAIQALHGAGIVHRDLKPENIFITSDGVVKILDLGAAKYLKENPDTTEGNPMGTPLYMSPEHLSGVNVDVRTDVFALGHILYYCIAGHHVLLAPGAPPPIMGQIVARQIAEVPRRLTDLVPGLPPVVWGLVAKALEKDRVARYATSADFGQAIRATQAWLAARGLSTAGDPPVPQDTGAPDRSIVRVVRRGEQLPSNLPYVSTAEGSPSLTTARDANVIVQKPPRAEPAVLAGPAAAKAVGSHGTEIISPAPRTPQVERIGVPAARPTGVDLKAKMQGDHARAAQLLTQPPSTERTIQLAQLLFLSFSEPARCDAARALVAQADRESITALVGAVVCEFEVSPRVREIVETGLARVAPEFAGPAGCARGARGVRMQRLADAIGALERAPREPALALDALSVAVHSHPWPEVRRLAALALVRVGDDRCAGMLETAARQETDPETLGLVREALDQFRRDGTAGDAPPSVAARNPPMWAVLACGAGAVGAVVALLYYLLGAG